MNSDIVIDASRYPGAAMYAKLHNISFKQLVDSLLVKFQSSAAAEGDTALSLPPRLEKLGGCLAGVEDADDERLNYLLEKYK